MKKTLFVFIAMFAFSPAWADEVITPATCQVTSLQIYNLDAPALIESVENALIAKGYDLSLLDMQNVPGWRYSSAQQMQGLSIYAGEQFIEAQAQHGTTRRQDRRARRYERRSSGSAKTMLITGPRQRSAEYGNSVPTLFTADGRSRRFQRTSLRHQGKVANWVIDQLPECQASSP